MATKIISSSNIEHFSEHSMNLIREAVNKAAQQTSVDPAETIADTQNQIPDANNVPASNPQGQAIGTRYEGLTDAIAKMLTAGKYTPLPSTGKYKVVMPLRDIYTIFMKTIEANLSTLQVVADDPQKLAVKLTEIFKPEDLNITFEVPEDRFDDLGDGAFLHGGVSDPSKVPEGELPTVTMILNKYTGEAIKNWNNDIDITGGGFTSAKTATGKELMASTTRSTIVHEFIHQAQSQDPEINMGVDDDKLFARLGELVGADPESTEFGQHMVKFIEQQVSQEFLNDKNKSEEDKEIRDIVNKVYYASEDEFTGWAHGVPSDLIDAALRNLIPGLEGLKGVELKKGVINFIDHLIKNADKEVPPNIAKENAALRFYGHPEGFIATYGVAGYKEFLQIAKGYAEKYPESMYR